MLDKRYCCSSFLMYRTIADEDKTFSEDTKPKLFKNNIDRKGVVNSEELEAILAAVVSEAASGGKTALALSGGIDSAILAKYMPKGSVAYTFRCIVPETSVVDETNAAAAYASYCGLDHRIVNIYWDDVQAFLPRLMKAKGAPIHSIEVQIFKAALQAKKDGFDTLVFGESADVNYGGQDGLLSRDWTTDDYMNRYAYVMPDIVLKDYEIIREPFEQYSRHGLIDAHEFNRNFYYCESMASYTNACDLAGIKLCAPFSKTYMGIPLDYNKIRNGRSKYLVREIFERLYPGFEVPAKIPMPRPMNEWLKSWEGPKRDEFIPHCTDGMTGDQKWLVYCLEQYLDLVEG